MTCPIRPINDFIVVERFDTDKVTPGGLVLPGGGGPLKQQGKVIAVGPGRKTSHGRIPMDTKPGDTVCWYQGHVRKVFMESDAESAGKKPYILLKDSEVLAVLE